MTQSNFYNFQFTQTPVYQFWNSLTYFPLARRVNNKQKTHSVACFTLTSYFSASLKVSTEEMVLFYHSPLLAHNLITFAPGPWRIFSYPLAWPRGAYLLSFFRKPGLSHHPIFLLSPKCQAEPKILPYLKASKLGYHNFMNTGRRHEHLAQRERNLLIMALWQ